MTTDINDDHDDADVEVWRAQVSRRMSRIIARSTRQLERQLDRRRQPLPLPQKKRLTARLAVAETGVYLQEKRRRPRSRRAKRSPLAALVRAVARFERQ